MYSQQQASSSSQQCQSDSYSYSEGQDLVSGASVCEQDLSGNQAQVADAGLQEASTDDGSFESALALMGTLVLDCMPTWLAVCTASRFVHIPEVAAWVDELDVAEVGKALGETANEYLAALWPEGTGFELDGALGGDISLGGDIEGTIRLVRTAADTVEGTYDGGAEVGLMGAGAGVMLKDAFGEDIAGAMAAGGLSLTCTADGDLETRFDLGALLASSALVMVQSLSVALTGAGPPAGIGSDLLERIDGDPWTVDYEAAFGGKVSGTAAVALDDATAPLLDSIVRELGDVAVLGPLLAALAQVSASGTCGLQTSDAGLGIHGVGGLSLLASLSSQLPILNSIPGLPDLTALAGQWEDSGELEFFLPLDLGTGTLTTSTASAWIRRSTTMTSDGAEVTDAVTMSLQSFAATFGQADADGLATVLADDSTAMSRDLNLPLDDDALDHQFPDWSTCVAERLGLTPGLQLRTELAIEGSVLAGPQALGQLVGAGIAAPEGWSGAAAVDAIGRSLIALRSGGSIVETWLAPWQEQLEAAAEDVQIERARAVGTLRAGVGGAASVKLGPSGSAEARANGGLVIDCPLNEQETQQMSLALRQVQAS